MSSSGGVAIGNAVQAHKSSLDVHGTSADGTPSSLTSGLLPAWIREWWRRRRRPATAQVAGGAQVSTANVQVFKDIKLLIEREDLSRNSSRWDAELLDVFGGFVENIYRRSSHERFGEIKPPGDCEDQRRRSRRSSLAVGHQRQHRVGKRRWIRHDPSSTADTSTSETAEIGVGSGSNLLSLDGLQNAVGLWQNSGDVYVGGSDAGPEASGDLRLNDEHSRVDIGGTLTVWGPGTVRNNGGEMNVDVVDHTHGGTFEFNAGTFSVNRFDGNLLNPAGTLTPGVDSDTAATLIDGNYTQQSDATLSLDIGGTGPGSTHDLVSITGDAQVDGLLELSLLNEFTPSATEELTVLAADSLIGFFDNVATGQRLSTSDGRGSFVVNYGIGSAFDESRIVLSDFQLETVTADLNMDGFVDGLDLGILLGNFESNAIPSGGELNGTDPVDGLDLGILLGAWNPPALSALVSVPEPGSAASYCIAMVSFASYRQRRISYTNFFTTLKGTRDDDFHSVSKISFADCPHHVLFNCVVAI